MGQRRGASMLPIQGKGGGSALGKRTCGSRLSSGLNAFCFEDCACNSRRRAAARAVMDSRLDAWRPSARQKGESS